MLESGSSARVRIQCSSPDPVLELQGSGSSARVRIQCSSPDPVTRVRIQCLSRSPDPVLELVLLVLLPLPRNPFLPQRPRVNPRLLILHNTFNYYIEITIQSDKYRNIDIKKYIFVIIKKSEKIKCDVFYFIPYDLKMHGVKPCFSSEHSYFR